MFIHKVLNPQPKDRWAAQKYVVSPTLGLRKWDGLHYGDRAYERLNFEKSVHSPETFINHYAPLIPLRDATNFKNIIRVMIANAMGLKNELNELLIELGI